MTQDVAMLGALLLLALVGFVKGPFRYDIVALLTLLAATLLGLVPVNAAFSGFGHPAVITVAAVLVISRALFQSGFVDLVAGVVIRVGKVPTLQVLALTASVALLSAFMNNVGALALMLPVALKFARTHKLPPSRLLMPLSFGSLLGGLTTMIGTPPNIIIANYRAEAAGTPFGLFDYTPAGLGTALAGILFIGLIGWRLLPDRKAGATAEARFDVEAYLGELRVQKESKAIGMTVRQMLSTVKESPPILAVIRGSRRRPALSFEGTLQEDDILLVEGETEEIEALAGALKLAIGFANDKEDAVPAHRKKGKTEKAEEKAPDLSLREAVIMANSRLIGRSAADLRLFDHYDLNLIAAARRGKRLKRRLAHVRFEEGDVILLQGTEETLEARLGELGCLPLADRDLRLGKPRKLALAVGLFGAAIAAALVGISSAPVALVSAAVLMVVTGVVDLRSTYAAIDWPVLVLLAAMIPLGDAFQASGGAAWLANGLLKVGGSWPPLVSLAALLILTMCLSDIINNTAAAVLMAPIAHSLATGMGASPDAFLMSVALGASCAFLTPIGHQSNTLVFGPGGYQFGDYWKLGLPLQILLVMVAIPLLLWAWPL